LVILAKDMPKEIFESISKFENIILINGSPLIIQDSLRANIQYANRAVILGNNKTNEIYEKKNDRPQCYIYL